MGSAPSCGVSTKMPASRQAAALTDAYRNRLLVIRQQATVATVRSWRAQLDPDRLDETWGEFERTAVAALVAAQAAGVSLTSTYLAAYLSAELARPVQTPATDTAPLIGVTAGGIVIAKALVAARVATKLAIGSGTGPAAAMLLGQNRVARTVASEAMAAPRAALADAIREDDRLAGWHRVVAPGACGACLALATGQTMDAEDDLTVHSACRCVTEPVVVGVSQRFRRPTGRELFDRMNEAEQDAMFGAEKASLVRDGAVPFAALAQHEHRAAAPDAVTERSLKSLQALA